MTLQQAKTKASELYQDGKWLELAILIFQFGKELVIYLRERFKSKQNESNQDKPIQSGNVVDQVD